VNTITGEWRDDVDRFPPASIGVLNGVHVSAKNVSWSFVRSAQSVERVGPLQPRVADARRARSKDADMKTVFALLMIASSLGCTHLGHATRAAHGDPDRRVYEWSRTDRNDTVRKYVRTTIVDDDRPCADIRLRRNDYSEDGELERRVVERRRCGYVEMRYVERYDPAGDVRVREVFFDKDHNGEFERHTVRQEPILGRGALSAGLQETEPNP
jgi:hypothetical protein